MTTTVEVKPLTPREAGRVDARNGIAAVAQRHWREAWLARDDGPELALIAAAAEAIAWYWEYRMSLLADDDGAADEYLLNSGAALERALGAYRLMAGLVAGKAGA